MKMCVVGCVWRGCMWETNDRYLHLEYKCLWPMTNFHKHLTSIFNYCCVYPKQHVPLLTKHLRNPSMKIFDWYTWCVCVIVYVFMWYMFNMVVGSMAIIMYHTYITNDSNFRFLCNASCQKPLLMYVSMYVCMYMFFLSMWKSLRTDLHPHDCLSRP